MKIGRATIHNMDCMDYMKGCKDNQFDLAIVDPPYGIDAAKKPISMGAWKRDIHVSKNWDNETPTNDYFAELKRISTNQIIWGGNYFIDYLKSTRCFVVWDKNNGGNNMADCELAWTSFKSSVRKYTRSHIDDHNQGIKRYHPTQKPVALYEWLLTNYAKQGDTILDTHMGSGSIAIATNKLGFDLTATELDKDYYQSACERIKNESEQVDMFTPPEPQPKQEGIF